MQALAADLRGRLGELPRVEVHDRGLVLGGTVTFTVAGLTGDEVKSALAAERINVSVSPALVCAAATERRGQPRLVRASVHYYNTDAELDRLVRVVADL